MKFFGLRSAAVLAAPLLLSLSEVARAADVATEEAVMVVTADTIEQAIKDHSHLVVEFYAPCECTYHIRKSCRQASQGILRASFWVFVPSIVPTSKHQN